jgi:nucleotide-binding universal stress UspA family protein
MYTHILVPTDGSPVSEGAADAAIHLARRLGARITAIHVLPARGGHDFDAWIHQDPHFEAHLDRIQEQRAALYLETIRDMARRAGVACDCCIAKADSPHERIIGEADALGCDLIFMASHGRHDHAGSLLASETLKTATFGTVPVLIHHAQS